MALGVSDIIAIAKISQYLAQNDVNKGSLFGARVSPLTPKILYLERKGIEYIYDLDPNNTTLTSTANYLYAICRGYNLKAQRILAENGGGSVSPISVASALDPIQFEVDGSSLVATGGTTATISAYAGYNLLFVRGGVPQTTVNQGGGATYYSWDKSTAQFICSPAAAAGELFQFYPI